jgi:hypothetical protein
MKNTTNKTSPAPSLVSTSSAAVGSGFTLGLDLGDRQPWWWPVVPLVLCAVFGTLLILL